MTFYIYDNGSVASKLLKQEYKDAQVVKVSSKDLVENFTKFDPKKGKILLPFTVEELVENNEQLRREIQKVQQLGFNNLVVLPYEGSNTKDIEYRAKIAGVTKQGESLKGEESKPYKSIRTPDSKEV
jgi:hypothetical protein